MEEKRKSNFSSVYFPEDKKHLITELEELKWKERTTTNNLIVRAIEEYVKIHADGNPNFTLEQFQDSKMKACPAFFRPKAVWVDYFLTINDDKQQVREFADQYTMIGTVHNKVYSGKIKRHD